MNRHMHIAIIKIVEYCNRSNTPNKYEIIDIKQKNIGILSSNFLSSIVIKKDEKNIISKNKINIDIILLCFYMLFPDLLIISTHYS